MGHAHPEFKACDTRPFVRSQRPACDRGSRLWPREAGHPRRGGPVLTQTGQYAIRAVVCLAQEPRGSIVTAARVAKRTGLPHAYLAKILLVLAQAGLLDSARGPHGGYRLRQPADALTVADVLAAFGRIHQGDCMLNRTDCQHREPCRSRRRCLALSAAIDRFLRTTRIADLARPYKS